MQNTESQADAVPAWRRHIDELVSATQIQARLRALGDEIAQDYAKDFSAGLVVVGVLKGSFPFYADLVRQIDLPLSCEFIGLSSYGDATQSSGVVKMGFDTQHSIEGKHVLVVEDIVDTGLSMRHLLDHFATRKPRSLKLCTLLQKPGTQRVPVKIDYVGFTIADVFVVGYGLDYKGRLRNLPFVGQVHPGSEEALHAALEQAPCVAEDTDAPTHSFEEASHATH